MKKFTKEILSEKGLTLFNKIRLWVVFLPFSSLIVMLMIINKWTKLGISGYDKEWVRTIIALFIGVFPVLFILGIVLLYVVIKLQIAILSIVCAYAYFFIIPSIIMREIEHKRMLTVFGESESAEK